MNDLIYELQKLDLIRLDKAKESFQKSILAGESGIKYFIINENIIFEYTYKKSSWIGSKRCLNHNYDNYSLENYGKCSLCFQPRNLLLSNGTGIPNHKKTGVEFYQYYSKYPNKKIINRKLRENIPRDKLVIQQEGERDNICITSYFVLINNNEITDPKLKTQIKWLKNKNILLSIEYFYDLLPELKDIIKRFAILI